MQTKQTEHDQKLIVFDINVLLGRMPHPNDPDLIVSFRYRIWLVTTLVLKPMGALNTPEERGGGAGRWQIRVKQKQINEQGLFSESRTSTYPLCPHLLGILVEAKFINTPFQMQIINKEPIYFPQPAMLVCSSSKGERLQIFWSAVLWRMLEWTRRVEVWQAWTSNWMYQWQVSTKSMPEAFWWCLRWASANELCVWDHVILLLLSCDW